MLPHLRKISVVVPALLFTVACSGGQAPDVSVSAAAANGAGGGGRSDPPPTVEQLGARAGCKPKIQIDVADLRQGYCTTSIGRFFLTTFTTQQGKDEWMNEAPEGHPHLVGNLWTVLASRKVLERLRDKIGGDLHLGDHRIKTAAPSAGAG